MQLHWNEMCVIELILCVLIERAVILGDRRHTYSFMCRFDRGFVAAQDLFE